MAFFDSLMTQTNQSSCYNGTVGLESIGNFYNAYGEWSATPLTNRFFAPDNIVYLQNQLEILLTKLIGEPVKVPINEEFAQSMSQIASQNSAYAFMGDYGLQQLNEMFVEWEARIQVVSIRQQKRYDQYFIKEDRIKSFPYPEPTRSLRGETVIDTSGYMLTNPWKNNFGNFLNDVLQIGPYAAPRCCTTDNPNPYPQAVKT